MIVKNEEHVIERCLLNVRHLIDAVAIVDTGSSDKTISIINDFMKKENLPGEVISQPWVHFHINRTQAIRHAESFLEKIGGIIKIDRPMTAQEWSEKHQANTDTWYLLFMDADNTLKSEKVEPYKFNKEKLTADNYIIDMTQSIIKYPYSWLIKIDKLGVKRWKWASIIHEYVCPDGDWKPTVGKLTGGYIISGREGSRNKDPLKYLKDALILEQGLLDEPNNERYVFYLAQSYRDNVKHKLAIKYYIKRAEMGGWFEERYISYLEAGRLTLMCNPTKVAKALQYFIRAIDVNPKRLEAPYYLVRTARLNKLFMVGWLWGKIFIDLPKPGDSLFVDQDIHDWKFYDETAVCAFYANDKPACKMLSEKALIHESRMDPGDRDRIKQNIKFCSM